MKSKYELTISTGYVPDWTYVEAVRELFQNAIDNERVTPENKMGVVYDGEKLEISNRTSKLTLDSLLLGSSTKRDDPKTIGQHGEGYKIAFMVLLREGKCVTVHNYGANEIWTTRLVNSRRYNGAQVVQIEVDKAPIWKKVPGNDLTIIVDGISDDEYAQIVSTNLFLQDDIKASEMTSNGRVLFGEENVGKIFVKGLYVNTNHTMGLRYGYDFDTDGIKLDRDRKLVDSFNISWYASKIWCALANDEEYTDTVEEMIRNGAPDVEYVSSGSGGNQRGLRKVADQLVNHYKERYGNNFCPVSDDSEYRAAKKAGSCPVIVSRNIKFIAELSDNLEEEVNVETPLERLVAFKDRIKDKLTEEEFTEFEEILEDLENE